MLSSRSFALGAALLLVSTSYLLLLAAPAVSSHFRGLADGYGGSAVGSWLPVASVSGLALGGGAALLFVLMQIAREAAQRPYVAFAPVLAAFTACILIGLRAPLPLPGVASEHVAVFALAVSVVGGALVQEAGFAVRFAGLAFTLLPAASLLVVVWTVSGKSDPWLALWSLPAATRAYLTMLAVSSSAIALLAVLGRRLALDEPAPRAGDWSLAAQADAMMAEAYERSYAADEAALARRGLPTWLVASLSAVAVVGGFFALKVYLDGRATRATLALVSSPAHAPIQVDPAPVSPDAAPRLAPSSAPTVTSLSLPGVAPSAASVATAAAAERVAPEASPAAAVRVERAVHVESFSLPREPSVATAEPSVAPRAHRSARKHRAAHAVLTVEKSKPEPQAVAKSAAAPVSSAKAEPKAEPVAPAKIGKSAEPTAAKAAAKAEPSLATRLLAKPTEKAAPEKVAPTRGDESLDELMDNVVKSKRAKSAVGASDDPIFGL